MNRGVKMSSGDYVIFLNAGDLFADATTLEKIFKDKIYDSYVIYGDVIKNGKIKPAEKPHNAHKMYFCHQSCFTKLTCLRQFPFDTKYKMSADFNFFKILTLNNKTFKQLNIPIAIFDTTGVSNTKRSKGLKENINVVNEHDNIINKVRLLPRLYFVYWYAKLRGK